MYSETLSSNILYTQTHSVILFWCPCMVTYVNVQYNDGLLPDVILLTLCDFIEEPL